MARQLFTAKSGGVSTGDYGTLNLAFHVGDNLENVKSNREKLKSIISVPEIQFMEQVHGNNLAIISNTRRDEPVADAMVTTEKNIALAVMVADCLPILIEGTSVIGAVHVGRKGMLNGILTKTVLQMKDLGGTNLKATIGPGICGSCYEVDETMYGEIIKEYPASDGGYRKINIRSEVNRQLESLGVLTSHIDVCTLEDERYYSFRRNHTTGRQCGVISL
jgi:YfiH family protein